MKRPLWFGLAVLVVALVGVVAFQQLRSPAENPTASPRPEPTEEPTASPGEPVIVLAAGDIASCTNDNDEATAKILDQYPAATILTLGDNVYDSGKITEYQNCFEPTWGRHKARMRPAIGNHDYGTAGGRDYFTYFGLTKPSYYSFNLGNWHFVALDSNCSIVSCAKGSEQETWLRADLAANQDKKCTAAYMHHPRFSSGTHGNYEKVGSLWETLYEFDTDLVLAGHDHTYERIAPLKPDGYVDNTRGMRSFIVGTGGKSLYQFKDIVYGSERRNNSDYGILKLSLADNSYTWEFLPIAGSTFTDSGSGLCH